MPTVNTVVQTIHLRQDLMLGRREGAIEVENVLGDESANELVRVAAVTFREAP
jgi:hypothetical protein